MDNILSLPSNAYRAFSHLVTANQAKNVILDPLTTIIRLAILKFKENGTKIGINQHQISYYSPTDMQGVYRFFCGDKRSDLHNLYQPIRKATEWYNNGDNPKHKYIFAVAHQGLVKLKENYYTKYTNSDNSTYMMLASFDNILTGKQKDIYNSVSPEKGEEVKQELMDNSNNIIHQSLRQLWNENDISVAFELLKKMEEADDEVTINGCIKSLSEFLQSKDTLVEQIVVKNSVSL